MVADYLSNLLKRTFSPADSVRPRLPEMFEPPTVRRSPAGWNLQPEDAMNEQAHVREPLEQFLDVSSVSESGELPLRLPEDRQSESKASLERPANTKKQSIQFHDPSTQARQAPSSTKGKPSPLIKVDQNPDRSVSNSLPRRTAGTAPNLEEKEPHQIHRGKAPEEGSSRPFLGSALDKHQQFQSVIKGSLSQRAEAYEMIPASTVLAGDKTKTSQVPEMRRKKSTNEGPRGRLAVVVPRLEPRNEVPIPTTFKHAKEKPQVVIGRIKVEVVQEHPKPEPVKVITVNPRGSGAKQKHVSGIQSKLRFGIGQM